MAYKVNQVHIVYLKAEPDLTQSDFTITFLKDALSATCPLTFNSLGTGLYSFSYTPTLAGNYFLGIEHQDPTSGITRYISDNVSIDSDSFLITLTQNYGSTNRFKVPTPTGTAQIKIYKSADWLTGNQSSIYVVAATNITTAGDWVTSDLQIIPGTYHVIYSLNNGTTVKILAAFMVVS